MEHTTTHNLTGPKHEHNSASQRLHQAVIETLEGRQLMSSAVSVADGVLTIAGNRTQSNIMTVRLDDSGESLDVRVNGVLTQHSAAKIKQIKLIGGEKADLIFVDDDVRKSVSFDTGEGRDSIFASDGHDFRGDRNDIVKRAWRGKQHVREREAQLKDNSRQKNQQKENRPVVESFTLINADTDQVIATLADLGNGVTLNLATLPTKHLNIRANISGPPARSVIFTYDGETGRMDNFAPYSFAGEKHGDYNVWTPAVGAHTLEATPYSGESGRGVEGESKSIKFTIVNKPPGSTSSEAPSAKPEKKKDSDAKAPAAKIELISKSVPAGHAIHVNALDSKLNEGTALDARYEWDFGDEGSKYNELVGFNAAHSYERAGAYTITLKVTNSAGNTDIATARVTITEADRTVIYVSNDGTDSNSGLSADNAIKSWKRALEMVDDNTEILFKRGDRWEIDGAMKLCGSNIVVGAYGTGNRPLLKYSGPEEYKNAFSTLGGTNVTVRDLAIDSTDSHFRALSVGGENITVKNVEFIRVGYGLNTNHRPHGLLVQDNVATRHEGIHSYLVWAEGSDHVYLGNKAVDSFHGHIVRIGGVQRMLIAHNDFANPTTTGVIRGTLTVHEGEYIYIASNKLAEGKLTIGPLGEGDGLRDPDDRMKWVVAEDNQIESPIIVEHGSSHVMLRNNVVRNDGGYGIIEIEGYSHTYDRGVEDVHVLNNTGVNYGSSGNFLRVTGEVEGITVRDNLYVAPNLVAGNGSAAVRVLDTDLSSFRLISGNIWPDARTSGSVEGVNLIGDKSDAGNYRSASEWNGFSVVEGDVFRDVTLDSGYQATADENLAGATL